MRATGVRSRYVTAAAGVILIVIALFAPLGRLANAIPAPVVGGTAMIVFAIIGAMGIDMLRKVDLREHGNMFTLAGALTMGLLPILVPGLYSRFPADLADRARQRPRRWARSPPSCSTSLFNASEPRLARTPRRRSRRRISKPPSTTAAPATEEPS